MSGDDRIRGSREDRTSALVAGIALAAMAVLGGFAGIGVMEALYTPGEVEQTARDVRDAPMLLRTGALAFLVIAFLDVVVAWALRVFLGSVDDQLAVLAAWLRTTYAAVLLAGTGFLLRAADLADREGDRAGAAEEIHEALATFQAFWDVGLAVFGAHLVLVGWLCWVSARAAHGPRVPRWVGVLVVLAGLGYVADAVAVVLGAGPGVGQVTFVGEVVLLAWMLWFWLRVGRSGATHGFRR